MLPIAKLLLVLEEVWENLIEGGALSADKVTQLFELGCARVNKFDTSVELCHKVKMVLQSVIIKFQLLNQKAIGCIKKLIDLSGVFLEIFEILARVFNSVLRHLEVGRP